MSAVASEAVGASVDALPTPCLVVDLDRLEANLARMAQEIAATGARLRPHTKTHKTAEVARMQLEHGAAGIAVAKLGEAEAMADAGLDDILVANEVVGAGKAERLAELVRHIAVRTCVDGLDVARRLSAAAAAAGVDLPVLLDVDSGLGRAGVAPERAVDVGTAVAGLPGLDLVGVFSYAGNRAAADPEDRRRWALREAELAVGVAGALRDRGVDAREVSVAGTASAPFAAGVPGVTEVRPGTYVFGDMNSVRLGLLDVADCALRVQATVVSRPARDRAVLDAGSKALTSDPAVGGGDGHGTVPERPDARLTRLWEEHGVMELGPEDRDLAVGDVVGVIPNHVCPVVNLADRWFGVRGDTVERVFAVIGRGRVT